MRTISYFNVGNSLNPFEVTWKKDMHFRYVNNRVPGENICRLNRTFCEYSLSKPELCQFHLLL